MMEEWYASFGLKVNPAKTALLTFTRQENLESLTQLQTVQNVKYLD